MNFAGQLILLADDEPYLTQIVSYNLQKFGAQVLIERDGEALCASALQRRPNLIITDFQMPRLDGFAACLRLKEHPETIGIPVIMISARGHRLSPTELARTNVRLVLPKPFSVKQLLAQVAEILETAPASQTVALRSAP